MTGEVPRVSIVVPAYNEGVHIVPVLDRLFESVRLQCEVLIIVDDEADITVPVVAEYARKEPRIRCLVNTFGRGPANAIRFGIDAAAAPVAVVTMADGCDDPRQIDDLARLVDRGVAIAAASRYMPGGQQVGGPVMKGLLSRMAGRSLRLLAHTGTRDATNSFKAYSTSFVRQVGIDSRHGFEIGIELTAKAKRLGLPVAEIPTIWLDRQAGVSNFQVASWIPRYLRWYRFAFGPRLTAEQIRSRGEAARQTVKGPGALPRTGPSEYGPDGPCERPVPGYSENQRGSLDNASIIEARERYPGPAQRVRARWLVREAGAGLEREPAREPG